MFSCFLLFLEVQNEVLVMAIDPSVTIPSNGYILTPSYAMLCGIVPNTTQYTVTWTTPNGANITAQGLTSGMANGNKFRVQNGMFGLTSFPQASSLTIMRLSYMDSGNYTCSVLFTGGTNSTGNSTIQLSLLGMRVHI